MGLTTEVNAYVEGFRELRFHLDQFMFLLLHLGLSCLARSVDHVFNASLVDCVKHVGYPLLIQVDPVLLIREVRLQHFVGLRIGEHVLDSQSDDVGYCRYLDFLAVDILSYMSTRVMHLRSSPP